MRARTCVLALLPLGAIWAFVVAQSTSEMFALMDRVATSPRAGAAEQPPAAREPVHTHDAVQAAPLDLDLEHEPGDEYEIDESEIDESEVPRIIDEYADEIFLDPEGYDESVIDYYEERQPVRTPAYPVVEPELEYPSVGDPRIDALLRPAFED